MIRTVTLVRSPISQELANMLATPGASSAGKTSTMPMVSVSQRSGIDSTPAI